MSAEKAVPAVNVEPAADEDLTLSQMSLSEAYNFSEAQIQRLHKRFTKLRKISTPDDDSQEISQDDFLSIPEIAVNPLIERIFATLDTNKNKMIDFEEFIRGISTFSVKGQKEEKWRFAFNIYDIDNDGFISNGELFQVLKMMVGDNLTDVQLQEVVDKTIWQFDLDKDGKISFEEFTKAVADTNIEEKMVIRF